MKILNILISAEYSRWPMKIFVPNFVELKMVDYKNFDFEESEPRDSDSPTVGDDMEGLYIRKRIYAKR